MAYVQGSIYCPVYAPQRVYGYAYSLHVQDVTLRVGKRQATFDQTPWTNMTYLLFWVCNMLPLTMYHVYINANRVNPGFLERTL